MKKLLVLFFAVCFLTKLPSQDLTWASPVTLSSTSVDSSDPRIVIDSSGNAVAAWVENGVIQANTQPVGGSWGTSVSISNSGASNPRLGIDSSGNVTALWIESGVVKVATLPSGGSWSAATALSGSGASQACLAVDSSGNAVAIWTRGGFIESSTQLVGGSWSLVSVLSASGSDVPHVAIGADGTVVAVWHMLSSGVDNVIYATALISGTWNTAKSMLAVTPGAQHNYPKVTVDAHGNATAVWFRYASSGSAFYGVTVISASLPKGASGWTAIPTILSNSTSGIRNPADLSLSLISDLYGNVLALWTNSYDGFTFTTESAEKPVSGNWAPTASSIGPSIYSFQADMSINATSSALATFMFFNGSGMDILAQETGIADPVFGFWTAPLTVSQGTENGYPRSAYTLSGSTANAVAVWINNNGTHNVIEASTGSKTAVAPPTSLGVTQSQNQFGVFSDWANTITWTASTTPNVVLYNLYRNGVYFAQVDGSTFSFIDHNTVQNGAVTYGVAAFDSGGSQSTIANVNFP